MDFEGNNVEICWALTRPQISTLLPSKFMPTFVTLNESMRLDIICPK